MYNNYYVYIHRTEDGRCLYVGKGTQGRAWDISSRDGYHKRYLEGYTHDYVEIVESNLSEEEAIKAERKLIREEDPPANIQGRER